MNTVEQLNQTLFLLINAAPDAQLKGISVAKFIAHDSLLVLIPLVFALLWFDGKTKNIESIIKSFFVVGAAMSIAFVAHLIWQHPRPFMLGLGTNFLHHSPNSSFPSNHGTVAFALAMTFLLDKHRITGAILLILALAVAWSRIYLGVHFPLDMVGALVAALLGYAFVTRLIWPRIQPSILRALPT